MKLIGKILFRTVAIILILALILVGLSIFVTPATFGLEGLSVNGVTLESMGLSDVSFYNIGKIVLGILTVQEDQTLSEDSYLSVSEKLPSVADSDQDAASSMQTLVDEPLYFEEEIEMEMDSNELSAVMNMALGTVSFSDLDFDSYVVPSEDIATATLYYADKDGVLVDSKVTLSDVVNLDSKVELAFEESFDLTTAEMIKALQEFNSEFVMISPSVDGDNIELSIILKMYLPEDAVAEINSYGLISVTEVVYLALDSTYTLEDGQLVTVPATTSQIRMNSLSIANTQTIMGSLMSMTSGETVDGESYMIEYGNMITELVARILNNLAVVDGVDGDVLQMTTRTK